MPRFQRSQRQFSRRSRPNRTWTGLVQSSLTTVSASSKVLISSVVLSNQGIDETILRVVGGLRIMSDQTAATEDQIGAFGLVIITDAAFAIGITAISDPVTEISDDGWMTYVPFAQRFRFLDASGFSEPAGGWYPFDSRGKRILSSGQRIAVVIANAGSTGLLVSVTFRLLAQVRGT